MIPVIGGRYRHYKGNEYTVLSVARHSETLENMVVYRAEYGERDVWVRPAEMFLETVRVGGESVRRFSPLGETVRAALPGEAEEAWALCRSLVGTPGLPWDDGYPLPELFQRNAQAGNLYVLYVGETLVGCAILAPDDEDEDRLPVWTEAQRPLHFRCVAVRREYQRQGYGRKLLNALLAGTSADAVRLLVGRNNPPARALYRSVGFSECCAISRYGHDFICAERKTGK